MQEARQLRFIGFLFFIFLNYCVNAQTKTPITNTHTVTSSTDTSKITILKADVGEFIVIKNETVRKLLGNVLLKDNDALIFCDSAILDNLNNVFARGKVIIQQPDSVTMFADSVIYIGATRQADMFGDVILIDKSKKLFTQKLHYDFIPKIATYNTPGLLDNGRSLLKSQRGQYFVQTHDALFKSKVLVSDKDFDLKTDTLRFNTESQIAYFLAPTLVYLKDTARFYTEGGFYNTATDQAEFHPNAQYEKKDRIGKADTILYDARTHQVTLVGNALVKDSTREARAKTIRYNTQTEATQLEGKAFYKDTSKTVDADTIRYDTKSGNYVTRGRTQIENNKQFIEADAIDYDKKDSIGIATGNVVWRDTANKTTLTCQRMEYAQERDYVKASGNRPILASLIERDTLWMRADTIISFRNKIGDTEIAKSVDTTKSNKLDTLFSKKVAPKLSKTIDSSNVKKVKPILSKASDSSSLKFVKPNLSKTIDSTQTKNVDSTAHKPKLDTARTLLAYHHVRMYKKTFQAVCDSLSYSERDSVFKLFVNPFVWSDTAQLKGDTIHLLEKKKHIDRVLLKQNASIINSTDEKYFNEITGKNITAFFLRDSLDHVRVVGNSESVYYVTDDLKAYISVNKIICSEIEVYFARNKVDKIKFYKQPKATMYPMKQANHEALRLKNFIWETKSRPKNKDDL